MTNPGSSSSHSRATLQLFHTFQASNSACMDSSPTTEEKQSRLYEFSWETFSVPPVSEWVRQQNHEKGTGRWLAISLADHRERPVLHFDGREVGQLRVDSRS